MKAVKSFTINRNKWCVPDNYINNEVIRSSYRTEEGTFCCLGFHAVASGVSEKLLFKYEIETPQDLVCSGEVDKSDDIFGILDSSVGQELMDVNDNSLIKGKVRENRITRLFNAIGVKVKFVGKYRKKKL